MPEAEVFLSRLASEQLANLSPSVGRTIAQALVRLTIFPEADSPLAADSYEEYRQVVVQHHRAIYRFFPERNEVRVYCVISTRRTLPAPEFLIYQMF
jgi:plasmid stabilization system protein ParE